MKFEFHNKTDLSCCSHIIVITKGENHYFVHLFHNGVNDFNNVVITTIFMKFVPGEGPTRARAPRASESAASVRKYLRRAIIKYCFPNISFLLKKTQSLSAAAPPPARTAPTSPAAAPRRGAAR